MEVVYTYHARRRMGQRKVTPEQVEEVLAWPDDTLQGDYDEEIAINSSAPGKLGWYTTRILIEMYL